MSKLGRLPQVLKTIPCDSEVEALRLLGEQKETGHKAHYIRHHRKSFTVVVMEVAQ